MNFITVTIVYTVGITFVVPSLSDNLGFTSTIPTGATATQLKNVSVLSQENCQDEVNQQKHIETEDAQPNPDGSGVLPHINHDPDLIRKQQRIDNILDTLTPIQRGFVQECLDTISRGEQILFLVYAAPGEGKSFMANCLMRIIGDDVS